MSQPYVGQIIPVGFNFAPVGWLLCNGQLLSIPEYQVLFALIGTTYGGDGTQTFAIPDLRGRVPLNMGQGSGISNYVIGQQSGTESVTLTSAQLGQHSHRMMASSKAATATTPATTTALGNASAGTDIFLYGTGGPNTNLAPTSIGTAGSSLPHENRQPYLALNFIIAAFGVFPSQN